jgi:hypothetical protein
LCGEDPPKRATARLQYRRRAEIGGSDGPTYKYKGAFTVKSTPIRIKYQGTAMPIASSSRPPPMPQLSQPRQPSPGMGSKGPKNPDLGPFSIKAIARAVVKSELKSHSDPHLYRFYDCIHIVPDSGREAPFIQFNQLVLCTLPEFVVSGGAPILAYISHPVWRRHVNSMSYRLQYIAYLLYAFPGARQGCYSIDP